MSKGPGLWSDVGKRTKDLLYKDFLAEQKFTLTTTTSTGLTFTSTGVKKGEVFDGDVVTQFKNKNTNTTVDLKVDTKSNIYATVILDEIAAGTKAIFNFTIPDQKSGKVELQHFHQYAGLTTTVGLTSSPIIECTSAIGQKDFAVGGEAAFDTASGAFTKYNVGIGMNKPDFSAALVLYDPFLLCFELLSAGGLTFHLYRADKGDTIKASYSHVVNPFARTTVGAEMTYKVSKRENTFTMGGMYGLDPLTTLKARINNRGMVGAVIQHEWRPKSLITISSEVDMNALDRSAKVGLGLSLKP